MGGVSKSSLSKYGYTVQKKKGKSSVVVHQQISKYVISFVKFEVCHALLKVAALGVWQIRASGCVLFWFFFFFPLLLLACL